MPDYMYLMESRLSPEQRELMARIQEVGQAHGTNVYLTGGAVRDLLTGMPIRDLDFTLEANPERMAHELEKQGARVLEESERLRHFEMVWKGDVDFSLAAARDDVYSHPGARPELRFSPIMEDLRRRDISVNAIAVSLNAASRGLLLDPTNGLADIQKREIRVLTMHSFTNQPGRLLRVLRYAARLEFKVESRTADWMALAMERRLHESMDGAAVGPEVRHLAREDRCIQILKTWEARGLIGAIHPRLAKRHPDYEGLVKLGRAREALAMARVVARLFAPATHYLLARLSPGERGAALRRMELRSAEIDAVHHLEHEAVKVVKMLKGRKTASPRDSYYYLESVRPDLLAFILAEFKVSKVLSKIRMYLAKWRPLKLALPAAELEALGIPRGPKFEKILIDLFHLQLAGKGRNPQDRVRILRNLAGIKPEPKKKEKEKEKEKTKEGKKGKEGATSLANLKVAAAAASPPPVQVKGKGRKAGPPPAELEGEAEPSDTDVVLAEDEDEIPLPKGKRPAQGSEEEEEEADVPVPGKKKEKAAPLLTKSKVKPAPKSKTKPRPKLKAKPKARAKKKSAKKRPR